MLTMTVNIHRNKENEPSSLNGNAPPRRARRSNAANPYEKRIPFSQVPAPSSLDGSKHPATASRPANGTSNPSSSHASIQEETSPIIRGILEKTGCSSRKELQEWREAQQANSNAPSSTAKNGSTNTATNGSKSTAKNGSKSSTNRAKAKSTNGSKSTNPKKKSKGIYYV